MKSENSQHIYKWHKGIETEFGTRCMTELGNIRGLELDEAKNYILIPIKHDGEKVTAWIIKEISEEVEIPIKDMKDDF